MGTSLTVCVHSPATAEAFYGFRCRIDGDWLSATRAEVRRRTSPRSKRRRARGPVPRRKTPSSSACA